MALIAVMSAKGAPGTTTTAMLLASLWPRPTVLVDADPLGGDVALRLPTEAGRAMDRERGLLSLLPAARRGLLPEMVAQHAQTALGGQLVVAGLDGPEQSAAVTPLWPALADAFAGDTGADVVVDAGQVHRRSPHLPLLERADAVLWVYRPTAWSVLHTRRRLEGLAGLLADSPTVTGVVAVAPPERSDDVDAAARTIVGDWRWARSYDAVALDRRAVVMFEGVDVHRPERTLLARSGTTLAQRLFADLAAVAPLPDAAPEEDGDDDGPVAAPSRGRGRRRLRRGERTP